MTKQASSVAVSRYVRRIAAFHAADKTETRLSQRSPGAVMASQARLVNAVQAHRISVYKELLAGMAGAVDWVLVYSAKPEDRLAQLVYFLKQAIPTSGPFVVREVYQSGTDVCIRFIGRYHQQDYADLAERLFHCTLEQYQTFVPTAQA